MFFDIYHLRNVGPKLCEFIPNGVGAAQLPPLLVKKVKHNLQCK